MGIVFAVTEASRLGAESVVTRVCELLDGLAIAVPYTTRSPRSAEDDGFIFTSQGVFERMIASDEFLEHGEILGLRYGTPRQSLQDARDSGNDLLVRVDEGGLSQVKEKLPEVVSILVLPSPSGQREREAAPVANETLLYRHLHEASQVLNHDKFDHVIANDRLEDSVKQVIAIIQSERARQA